MQVRTGNPIQLGSCTNCNEGCRGKQDDADRLKINITEFELRGFTFRLCDSCKSELNKVICGSVKGI